MDPVGFSLENYDAVGRWRTAEDGEPIDAAGGLPDGSKFDGVAGLQQALLSRPEIFVDHAYRKTADLRTGPRRRVLRRAGGPQDRPRRPGQGLSFLVAHPGNRQQHAVSDEEIAMIITKKALPRRTFLRGVGATLALPLLDAMVPVHDRAGRDAGQSGAPPGLRLHPDGLPTSPQWTPAGRGRSRRAFAHPQLAGAVRRQLTVHHQPGAEERLSRARTPRRTPPSSAPPRRSGPRAPTTTSAPRSIRSPRSRSARRRSCRRSNWRWIC